MHAGARLLCCCLLLIISASFTNGQSAIDSLILKITLGKKDSLVVQQLNQHAFDMLKSSPPIARQIARASIDISSDINYKKGIARAFSLLGSSYWYEGIYDLALDHYLHSLRLYEDMDDRMGTSLLLNNIAELYKKQKDYEQSLQKHLQSLSIKESIPGIKARMSYYNIGELYFLLKDYNSSMNYITKALEIAEQENDERVKAYALSKLGDIYAAFGDLENGIKFNRQAVQLWLKLGEKRALVDTYQELSNIYLDNKNYSEAEKLVQEAIRLSDEINAADHQVDNYALYAHIDSIQGNYKRALWHLSIHNKLKDSIFNLEKSRQVNTLQTIYETEKREKENQLLKTIQKSQDRYIKAQNFLIFIISIALIILGLLLWMLTRQRRKLFHVNELLLQKNEEIESQANQLYTLNKHLHQLNTSLENRIKERTSILEKQNKVLAEYAFFNAHRLRAPVASILGLLNLIDQLKLSKEDSIIIEHLKTSGKELDNIIYELSKNLEQEDIHIHL